MEPLPPLMTFFDVEMYFGLDRDEVRALVEQNKLHLKVIPLGDDDYAFRITGASVEAYEEWLASWSETSPPV